MNVSSLDITTRCENERRSQESNDILSAFIPAIPDLVLLIEPDGRIVLVNEAAAAQLGMSKEEVIGRDVYALLPQNIAIV